uniref:Uncharacterized protein n=1 Tax=Rhizophora mucronata TaxID=61149 RepID=A0A2P2P7Z6_RHIMU
MFLCNVALYGASISILEVAVDVKWCFKCQSSL